MRRRLLLLASFILTLTTSVSVAAWQDSGGISLEAQAGFDGYYKQTAAVPVWVDVGNEGAPLEATIAVTVGDPSFGDGVVYTAPVSLPSQSEKRVPLYVYLPQFGGDLAVRLLDDSGMVAETGANLVGRVADDDLLYGVVSSEPGALAFLRAVRGSRDNAEVALLTLADLPDIAPGWQALDVLVLDDVDTSRLSAAQRTALQTWLENGGQLVVTGGPGGPTTAAGLAEFLPVTVTGSDSVTDLATLEAFAGVDLPGEGPTIVTTSEMGSGVVLIEQDGLPLLARRPIGRGSVIFLALDPKLDPLRGWAGATAIWETVAEAVPQTPPWGRGLQDGFAIGAAVAAIPGLELPSIWQLIAFLLIYTVVIGPINYLVLRRLHRPELAWITTPALVLLFSVLTLFTGFRTRGNAVLLNEMAVAYGHIDATTVQTQTAAGFFSPRRGTYDLVIPYETTAFPFGTGFSSLQSAGSLDAIERSAVLSLRGVRTDTSELATFLVNSFEPQPGLTAEATLREEAGGETLTFTVTNDAAFTLENATLILGKQQVALGDLAPGETRSITQPLNRQEPSPSGTVINPLAADASFLLGTTDYFADNSVFPRWQLLQALMGSFELTAATLPDPAEVVTLAGWANTSTVSIESPDEDLERTSETLYFLEVSVR